MHPAKSRAGLDNHSKNHYNNLAIGVWRSLVSRLVRVQEASGSNPDTPTKIAGIAQAVPAVFIAIHISKIKHNDTAISSNSGMQCM